MAYVNNNYKTEEDYLRETDPTWINDTIYNYLDSEVNFDKVETSDSDYYVHNILDEDDCETEEEKAQFVINEDYVNAVNNKLDELLEEKLRETYVVFVSDYKLANGNNEADDLDLVNALNEMTDGFDCEIERSDYYDGYFVIFKDNVEQTKFAKKYNLF